MTVISLIPLALFIVCSHNSLRFGKTCKKMNKNQTSCKTLDFDKEGRVEMIANLAFMCDNLNAKGIPEYLIQFVWQTKLISAKSFLSKGVRFNSVSTLTLPNNWM